MRGEKKSEEDYYELTNEIELARDVARDAARDVRHCVDCTEGWASHVEHRDGYPYDFAQRCYCFGGWQKAMWHLVQLGKRHYKQQGQEYANLITQEMRDLHTVKLKLDPAVEELSQIADDLVNERME